MPLQAHDDLDREGVEFCLEGDFNRDQRRDRAAVGVYETRGGERGTFIVVVTERQPGRWERTFLHAMPGAPGIAFLFMTRTGEVSVSDCLACDSYADLVWMGNAYVLRPHSLELHPEDTASSPASIDSVGGALIVNGKRIGPIPVDSSMGYIARLLPGFTVDSGYLETTPIIGWEFKIHGFSVWASQQDDRMNLSLPAHGWVIHGPGTLVLRGPTPLRIPAVWSDLRKLFRGRAEVHSGEIGTRATFCALPRLAFPLDMGIGGVDAKSLSPDSVPPSTQVDGVEVWQHEDTIPCVE